MLRHLYNIVLVLAVPVILARLLLRSLASPAYRHRIAERFAVFDLPASVDRNNKTIWIHAVSVGETVAAAPLIEALLTGEEAVNIVLTTTTPTGSARALELFGDKVSHVYAPYDISFVVKRFLKKCQPHLLVLMETELWPNLVHCCHQRRVRILLANARLSARSARGYQRFAVTTRTMLQQIDHIAAQAEADAQRFIELGASAKNVSITGSLKFYVNVEASDVSGDALLASVQKTERPVIIAASTREGEEAKLLEGMEGVLQQAARPLLLLVPRHPQRFDKVAQLCRQRGLQTQRRSAGGELAVNTQVLLGDSMGEMLAYYSLADIAFVGGSLVDTGCQNVLEPAALGLPVVVGPSQYNFATICRQLQEAGALRTVSDAQELGVVLQALLTDPSQRRAMAEAGRGLVAANRQALPALLRQIETLMA